MSFMPNSSFKKPTNSIQECQAHAGLWGPWPLSRVGQMIGSSLIELANQTERPRNLHSHSELAREVICDPVIRSSVVELFGTGYRLWRTNFFHRSANSPHPGVGWHHDKHFQDGDTQVDFNEVGDHISIVIALDQIDHRNGPFQYIPGSYTASIPGYQRDSRPYHQRTLQEHFLNLPEDITATAILLPIPAGHFCLFQSALLHGSAPSNGARSRTSMVGRLVRSHCKIPNSCAEPQDILPYC